VALNARLKMQKKSLVGKIANGRMSEFTIQLVILHYLIYYI